MAAVALPVVLRKSRREVARNEGWFMVIFSEHKRRLSKRFSDHSSPNPPATTTGEYRRQYSHPFRRVKTFVPPGFRSSRRYRSKTSRWISAISAALFHRLPLTSRATNDCKSHRPTP